MEPDPFWWDSSSYHAGPEKTITTQSGAPYHGARGGCHVKWRFGIIGGDRRQAELARMLAQDGHFVTTYGLDSGENMLKGRLEQALSADVVILPLPLCAKPGMITCAAEEIPVEALLWNSFNQHS